jgi:hypothetical protein
MADYQSLLTRAVSNLPSGSLASARQAIYDRARKALLTQLRTLRPPLPESDIAREEAALDQAIAQVEARFGSAENQGGQEPEELSAPPSASSGGGAAEFSAAPALTPTPGAPKPTPDSQAPAAAAARPAPQSPLRATQSRPPAPSGAQPSIPGSPHPTRLAPAVISGTAAPLSLGSTPAKPPQIHAHATASAAPTRGGAAAPIVTARTESSAQAPANLGKVVPSEQALSEGAAAPPVLANRADDDAALAPAPEVPADLDRPGLTPRLETEGLRPQAPTTLAEKRKSWPWLVLAVVAGIVLSVAGAAIFMRQKPQDLAIAPHPEPQQEASHETPAKIAQRAQPAPAPENNTTPGASESQPEQAAPANTQGQQATPNATNAPNTPNAEVQPQELPVAARAAMLIASPDNPQKPIVNLGSTVWSTIPATPGQPATVAVKADADIPDLRMHATMILRKNTDPTLQATHTIDLKFSFADGAPITGFKDVGLPQMRKLDSTASEALTSVKVKISDVYFLIALANGAQDIERNLDLMQTRAWFDFPLLLNDNRIAKLVFQKSADGEAMLAKAFEAWK